MYCWKSPSPKSRRRVEIGDLSANYDKVFILGYVLRYMPFFSEIKRVRDNGAIGKLKTVVHCENTGLAHYSHSYVRGTFGESATAGPTLLTKCCHDMDILNWLTDSKCVRLSSLAPDTYVRAENAPKGAPMRCTDGCPVSDTCCFYAPKMYSTPHPGFNVDMISVDKTPEGRMKTLSEGRFGRCVYHCENDVADTRGQNRRKGRRQEFGGQPCDVLRGGKVTLGRPGDRPGCV